ncbi:MAG: T9SS type A sorting domain-containing protein [Candidatus Komeilibacteria bacterium]
MKRWLILLFSTVVWAQNWQPVYELFNPAMADHFYTMNQTEVENATNNMDYTNHGIIYYWSSVPFSGGIPIYRLWHSYDHFYTTSVVERDACVSNGYTDEGIVGYLATTNSGNLFGWHRYYHSDWDDHAYPVSQNDRDVLFAAGYIDEGIHGYVWMESGDTGGGSNQPPDASWTSELYDQYNYQEISFSWQGSDDSTASTDLWYYVDMSGEDGFAYWTPNNYIAAWPGVGEHTLTITTRDLNNQLDPSPLTHDFETVGHIPIAPVNVAAVETDDGAVQLTWQSDDQWNVGFRIWRDYDQQIADLGSNARQYLDSEVVPGGAYRYTVVAYNYYAHTSSDPVYITIGGGQDDYPWADRFDYPVGYPDFVGGWYDAQPFGSVLADAARFHSGNDLNKYGGDLGEPIYAPANATIVYKTNSANGWGKALVLSSQADNDHSFRWPDGHRSRQVYFLLAHLQDIVVYGDDQTFTYDDIVVGSTTVQRGWQVATVGSPPSSNSPHLHLECWSEWDSDNPLGFGYYNVLPTEKYDAMEFIANNRRLDNSYYIWSHPYNRVSDYNNWFTTLSDGWQMITGYDYDPDVPIGYSNYFLAAPADQAVSAMWQWYVPEDGDYNLSVFIPSQFYTGSGQYQLQIYGQDNQFFTVNGGSYSNQWVQIGDFSLSSDGPTRLLLSGGDGNANEWLAADAIRLYRQVDTGGYTNIDEERARTLSSGLQVYPNPFNNTVTINFIVAQAGLVGLDIYNLLGQLVYSWPDEYLSVGQYSYQWQAQNQIGQSLPSGIYLLLQQDTQGKHIVKLHYLR